MTREAFLPGAVILLGLLLFAVGSGAASADEDAFCGEESAITFVDPSDESDEPVKATLIISFAPTEDGCEGTYSVVVDGKVVAEGDVVRREEGASTALLFVSAPTDGPASVDCLGDADFDIVVRSEDGGELVGTFSVSEAAAEGGCAGTYEVTLDSTVVEFGRHVIGTHTDGEGVFTALFPGE